MQNIVCVLTLVLLLVGCAPNISPDCYDNAEVGVVSRVKKGIIVSKRKVNIDNNSHVGGVAGAAAGAAAGSMVGSNVQTAIVGSIGGAVVGGLAANSLEKSTQRGTGYEYIIKLNDGVMISVVQSTALQFSLNEHVLVLYGAMTRIIHDDTHNSKPLVHV